MKREYFIGLILLFGISVAFVVYLSQNGQIRSLQAQLSEIKNEETKSQDQQTTLGQEKENLIQEIGERNFKLEDLLNTTDLLDGLIFRMTNKNEGRFSEAAQQFKDNRSIKIMLPDGSENLCLGEEISIRWQGESIRHIDLQLQRGGFAYTIENYYPMEVSEDGQARGEYTWRVGTYGVSSSKSVPSGDGYTIVLWNFDAGSAFSEETQLFSILRCEG